MSLRTRRPWLGAFGILVFALGVAACDVRVDGDGGFSLDLSGARAEDVWTRSYPLGAGGRLEIVNVNGRITAEGSDGATVEIRAERRAGGSSEAAAKELLGKIEMDEEVGEGRVRVEVRPPPIRSGRHEIRWTIRVPKGVSVDLRTVNGGVRVTGLDGEVRARATNGGISGEALRATGVDAGVTNGGVSIELAHAPSSGAFELESVNGGVSLTLPAESRADVTARCLNGGISVSGLDLQAEGEQSRRRVQGRLNGGGARVNLQTTNGGVRLTRTGPA